MTINRHRIYMLLVSAIVMSVVPLPMLVADAGAVDCAAVYAKAAKKDPAIDSSEMAECVRKGESPIAGMKPDGGRGIVKVGGSMGFSYTNIQAPKDSPGAVGVNASVSKEVIQSSCSFPPRIKLGIPPTVSFPAGSCADFLKGLFKDKNGKGPDPMPVPGVSPDDPCPIESDNSGIYGIKQSIAAGSSAVRSCGGLIPISTTDMVLNANATEFAATENGAYYIWMNTRNPGNGTYTPLATAVPLPTYLCMPMVYENGDIYWQKTVDLTPPIAQMITYDKKAGHISIKLQPRSSMSSNFIPAYNEGEPERYLIIPIAADGTPQIPKDCDQETTYFQTFNSREDIRINSDGLAPCQKPVASPSSINTPTISYDEFGKGIPNTLVNHWSTTCPDGTSTNPCAQPPGSELFNCAEQTNNNCDVVTIYPSGSACVDKTQYGVLNRPSLYYPAGSTTRVWPIAGRTTLLADTVAGNELYAYPDTVFTLRPTAAPIKFIEGGYIKLTNGQKLMLNPSATIDAKTNTITMSGGGQRITEAGHLVEAFVRGTAYKIPNDLIILPLQVMVERTTAFPAGYTVPTMPQSGTTTPYIRLPITKPQ